MVKGIDLSTSPRKLKLVETSEQGRVQPKKSRAALDVQTYGSQLVIATTAMSAVLNGFANWHHSQDKHKGMICLSVALGMFIPLFVLWLGKISASCYLARLRGLSMILAGVATFLLLLSVAHITTAVCLLTGGEPYWDCRTILSAFTAIGIDGGLVGAETAVVLSKE